MSSIPVVRCYHEKQKLVPIFMDIFATTFLFNLYAIPYKISPYLELPCLELFAISN